MCRHKRTKRIRLTCKHAGRHGSTGVNPGVLIWLVLIGLLLSSDQTDQIWLFTLHFNNRIMIEVSVSLKHHTHVQLWEPIRSSGQCLIQMLVPGVNVVKRGRLCVRVSPSFISDSKGCVSRNTSTANVTWTTENEAHERITDTPPFTNR